MKVVEVLEKMEGSLVVVLQNNQSESLINQCFVRVLKNSHTPYLHCEVETIAPARDYINDFNYIIIRLK